VKGWQETHCPTCGMHVPEIDRLRAEAEELEDSVDRLYERVKALELAGGGLVAEIQVWRKNRGGSMLDSETDGALDTWFKATGEAKWWRRSTTSLPVEHPAV
jgi:hypothetical protein